MEYLLFICWTGLVAGVVHVYLGIDHLAALMPVSVGRKRQAMWLGVRWGAGHSLGVLLVAVVLLATKATFDIVIVGEWSERLVGVMLIAFGIVALRAAYSDKLHRHTHAHDGHAHSHLHIHKNQESHAVDTARAHQHIHSHAALGAGTLHGLAGMAHLMGVLPALAFSSLTESFTYLAAFAAGSIVAMAVFAAAVGSVTARLGQAAPQFITASMVFAGTACLLVGTAWIVMPFLGYALP